MPFRTKLNLQDNRQHKLPPKQIQQLSGFTTFGIPFSATTSGPDPTDSGFTGTLTSIISTFSGNTGTTVFTFGDTKMDLAAGSLSAITPSNSATTQNTGNVWTGHTPTIIDGNLVYLGYSGVSFDFQASAMTEVTAGVYTGSGLSVDVFCLSADTLDCLDRLIYVNNCYGFTKTKDLIITDGATDGYVWTAIGMDGEGGWMPSSGTTGGTGGITADTFSTGATLVGTSLYFDRTDVLSAFTADLSPLLDDTNFYTTASTVAGTTAYFDRTDGLSAYTLDLSAFAGGASLWSADTGTNAIVPINHIVGVTGDYSLGWGTGNTVSADFASILGGADSTIDASANHSAILGGLRNSIDLFTTYSGILGGLDNTISGRSESFIIGGNNNGLSGSGSVLLGGSANEMKSDADASAIIASTGSLLEASDNSVLIAGASNIVNGGGAVVGTILTSFSNISGGTSYSVIMGGFDHIISGGSKSLILGGDNNRIGSTTSVIVGGSTNRVVDGPTGSAHAFIGGSDGVTVSGGDNSVAIASSSGVLNSASNSSLIATTNSTMSTGLSAIIGGDLNIIDTSGNTVAIIASSASTITSGATNTVILAGMGLTGTVSNMVYVPDMIIDGLVSTDPIATDANGKIVAGASDRRLKQNIIGLSNGLERIKNLRGVSYEWTKESNMGEGLRFGLIAQEVQEVIPEMVRPRAKGDGMLTLNYSEAIPWLIEAVKEIANGETTILNTILETQTIKAEDNNIELNYNGNHESAIGGGISIKSGIREDADSFIKIDDTGRWIIGPALSTQQLTLPEYTPETHEDEIGCSGDIVWDDRYLYIKTNNGWRRTSLEIF